MSRTSSAGVHYTYPQRTTPHAPVPVPAQPLPASSEDLNEFGDDFELSAEDLEELMTQPSPLHERWLYQIPPHPNPPPQRVIILEADYHTLVRQTTAMEPCPLLELPAEVRNDIYERALYEPKGLHFHKVEGKGKLTRYGTMHIPLGNSKSNPMLNSIALLSVCKQVRNEATKLFFAINRIEIKAEVTKSWYEPWTLTDEFSRLLQAFFRRLGAMNVALIPRFVIQIGSCNAACLYNASMSSRQYWDFARTLTEELNRTTTLQTESIHVAAGFKFFHSLSRWQQGGAVCAKKNIRRSPDCMTVKFALPPADRVSSIDIAEIAFAKKFRVSKSHEWHHCAINKAEHLLLAAHKVAEIELNEVLEDPTSPHMEEARPPFANNVVGTSAPLTTTSQAVKIAGTEAEVQAGKKTDGDQNAFASLEGPTSGDTIREADFFETMATPPRKLRQQTTSAPSPTITSASSTGKRRLPWATNAAALVPSKPVQVASSSNPIKLE
ncbi:hypothetical protein LTR37_003092 [Vermiconidia calcicola]|uniref:Uncharacterized protein n=1 Tax=Vermiconidia calcicola TaxID=1690605 RepID=A0ACC3NRC4_9PEZI|nr:hypothetical protein LTR37_003092 [Vermiconidia calcicola]